MDEPGGRGARRGITGAVPRLVDYSVRFAFLREASFTVVLQRGAAALSRRSVAAALGTSVNTVRRLLAAEAALVALAADEVDTRRRHGRLGRLRDAAPPDAAVHLLRKLLPDTEARIPEELVWLRLLLETHVVPDDSAREGLGLSDRFRVAEGRYDGEPPLATAPPAPPSSDPLRHHKAQRESAIAALVGDALDLLQVPEDARTHHTHELRALVSGLTVETCLAGLTPTQAVAVLEAHVRRIAPG